MSRTHWLTAFGMWTLLAAAAWAQTPYKALIVDACSLEAIGETEQFKDPDLETPSYVKPPVPVSIRGVRMEGRWQDTGFYYRRDLISGNKIDGPAIIDQMDSTTLFFPGQRTRVDRFLNLIIEETREGLKEID